MEETLGKYKWSGLMTTLSSKILKKGSLQERDSESEILPPEVMAKRKVIFIVINLKEASLKGSKGAKGGKGIQNQRQAPRGNLPNYPTSVPREEKPLN